MKIKHSPMMFLTFMNIASAMIGFAKGLIIVKLLGAQQYGVIAVIVGIGTTAVNFVDVRISDLIAKLYYETKELTVTERCNYRGGLLCIGIAIQVLLGLILGFIAFILGVSFLHFFTDTPVVWKIILWLAMAQTINYISMLFNYLQRLSERFFIMGIIQVLNSLLASASLVAAVYSDSSLSGYGKGMLFAATVSFFFSAGLCWHLWRRVDHLPILSSNHKQALHTYLSNIRFLFATNVLGYIKLLHRAADVLMVGFFCGDLQTGWYKLARSLTDSLYVLFDAANKVYQPFFLTLLSKNRLEEFKEAAAGIFKKAVLFTGLVISIEVVLLPSIINQVLGPSFSGILPIIVILTIPFLFVTGFDLWLWPLLVARGSIGRYNVQNLIAVGVGQYGLSIGLFFMTGQESAVWFGVGYTATYLILHILALPDAARRHPQAFPLSFLVRVGPRVQ